MVQALKEVGPNWRPYGQIVDDARSYVRTLRSWMVHHVKTDANSGAHSLAKAAPAHFSYRIWIEETSSCIYNIVTLEQVDLSI